MNRTYDALYILDVQGKEDSLKEMIEQIEKTINQLGGNVLSLQKMDRRKFERVAGKIDSGYYVNMGVELAPQSLKELETKLKANPSIFRQFYVRRKKGLSAVPKDQLQNIVT
ncbi:30S ribosomal protein S6 [Methylacidiphilum caldifontis]|uniref:Small ribosomal subunit protein bS6 n=1 Tax=Methylacidiphilum caldifontis TaxID=2795386 RepID=A0A4Y8PBK0_9BACT|nr:30S ribosomal protein S6 [Methylacidiphilum caldifontis]QSR89246.1 30S ribosomal protein S6 [Methylacidiphilum caldifontis]TFE68506.1 30S ribosomal protein S6 [Methylacidiphilum caldifontis]